MILLTVFKFSRRSKNDGWSFLLEYAQQLGNTQCALLLSYEKRIKQYLKFNPINGLVIALLRGMSLSDEELRRFYLLNAFAPIYDDAFDKHHLSADQINQFLADEECSETPVALLQRLWRDITNGLAYRDQLRTTIEALSVAQESSKSLTPTSSRDSRFAGSFQKGALSGLCFRYLMDHSIQEGELMSVEQLGAFGQLIDDIFDLWEDRIQGASSFLSTFDRVIDIRTLLDEQFQQTHRTFQGTGFDAANIRSVMPIIRLIYAIGQTGIDHYQGLWGKAKIDLRGLERHNVIVDMEKPINLIRLILNFASFKIKMT